MWKYPIPIPYPQAGDVEFTFFVENKQFLKTAAGKGLKLTPRG
jgi:hypothetical protein